MNDIWDVVNYKYLSSASSQLTDFFQILCPKMVKFKYQTDAKLSIFLKHHLLSWPEMTLKFICLWKKNQES